MGLTPLRRPPRLTPGDRVVIVSPSGPVPEDRLDKGVRILSGWGLDVVVAPHVLDRHPRFDYLAGTDEDRARDLQQAWCDPDVAGIVCARGGYGVQRLSELLDWDAMAAAEPKVFVGFSDITALHSAFASRLGVVTVHGPMAGASMFVEDARTADLLYRTLFEPDDARELTSPEARTLVPGTASGVTVGGCLSLLAGEIGTPTAQPGAAGGIVLLEDVGEKAYRLDGFLTHLLRAGWFDGVAGVALGSWKDCEPVDDVVLDRLGGLGVPIVADLGFGHCDSSITVPLGVPATLDADAGTLTLDGPALL
ncbi:muramoyltetrapeptide carboxypeptidase [Haloactinopolyspora alba]|uniref:Muramoyltetrapeptide carboxypeptidase n=1 Tax=Haloactinopolyspora alba TaxID=648780 RepID=A0A2P8DVC2_9ACTN|nr:LD-carboxypeptidase [Haloactinopolyspora alba]PSL01162.1 muramoyltetrapeptide carboxypeptidase [Haloactinopolyspora alba]